MRLQANTTEILQNVSVHVKRGKDSKLPGKERRRFHWIDAADGSHAVCSTLIHIVTGYTVKQSQRSKGIMGKQNKTD